MVYSFATNKYVHAGIIFFIVLLFSFYSPRGDFTTTPKFWRDEAIPFELARTYYELGKMDVVVSPGQVDGRPYLTHATGYPLLIPMAGVFSVFGVGVVQARIFMIFWIIAAVVALFFVLKSFSVEAAFLKLRVQNVIRLFRSVYKIKLRKNSGVFLFIIRRFLQIPAGIPEEFPRVLVLLAAETAVWVGDRA